jgi:hypothetical protein
MRLNLWLITYSHYLSFVVNGVSKVDGFCARSGIFLCLVISRVELIRKDHIQGVSKKPQPRYFPKYRHCFKTKDFRRLGI